MRPNSNLLKLHATVLVWGFTAILGSLISCGALVLVWYRMIMAAVCLFLYLVASHRKYKVGLIEILRYLGTGVLVALHWYLFYYSIKISTIAVALVSLSSITLFTSLLEPLVNRRPFIPLDFFTGLVIITGIALIFHFEGRYVMGTLTGLAAAATASLFTVFNARFSRRADPIVISFYEMAGGYLAITLLMLFAGSLTFQNLHLSGSDLCYLIILSTVCTALAYAVAVAVVQTLSPITVVLTTSLEPVYGILLAWIFFGKRSQMTPGFYLGASLILLSVFAYPLVKKLYLRKSELEQEFKTDSRNLLE